MARKFTLLAGGHEEKGVSYKAGDVVTSDQPLSELFGENKFRPVLSQAPGELAMTGDDVTDKYPIIGARGGRVIKDV